MKVSTVEQMRQLDKTAIEKLGIKDELLMENAGLAAYRVLDDHFAIPETRIAVICGSGNNGGDGLVIARHIHANGGLCFVVLMGDPEKFKGAAKLNYDIAQKLDFPMAEVNDPQQLDEVLGKADVIVDAVFGTGLTKNVQGFYAEAIEQINSSGLPVLAVDIPSGINGNNGQVMGIAVEADLTVSFGLPKLGNFLYPGHMLGGEHYVTHITFPPELSYSSEILTSLNIPHPLPLRDESGHKGTFGDVLFIAGAAGYLGAPYFASMSMLKAGGGYSRLAAPASLIPVLGSNGTEVVFLPQLETDVGSISKQNFKILLEAASVTDMTVVGPGLSLNQETQELVCDLVGKIKNPIVIDGDGITAVSKSPGLIAGRKGGTIITPHPGEMAKLTGKSIPQISENPIELIRETAGSWNSIIVLKGAHSLIGMPDGRVFINLSGNSGMASAGSGDVLTGAIAAMFGLGLTLEDSVKTGVFIHGFAGDLAAEEIGEDGMTARDILEVLPDSMSRFRTDYLEIFKNYYGKIEVI